MPHVQTMTKLIEDGNRIARFTSEDGHSYDVRKDKLVQINTSPMPHKHAGEEDIPLRLFNIRTLNSHEEYTTTEAVYNEFLAYFYPTLRTFNPETDNVDNTGAEPETPELELVQDPIIYNRPETGYSQENQHFFRFHNPNGKSAISIPMTNVDYTRFDSLNDDTHHYVIVTKSRVEIRCVSTVNEQLGLEFRFRGVTHLTSAEESNNVRQITESRANPT